MKHVNSKSSVHYQRNILGEWAMAEGKIYEYFNEDNIITYSDIPTHFDRLDIGCDYGVSDPNCFILVGTVFNETGNYFYCLDEIYYDPEVKGYSQTDSERVKDLINLKNKWNIKKGVVYLPHDAASLKEEANRHYHELKMVVEPFKPDTLECISVIQDLTFNNHLLVHEDCSELIKQFYTYSWDTKKQQRGIDYPLMVNDHAVDAVRAPIMRNRYGRLILVFLILMICGDKSFSYF